MEAPFIFGVFVGVVLGLLIYACTEAWLTRRLQTKTTAPEEPPPNPGEKWAFTNQKGPWPVVSRHEPVQVRDVTEGWVRYSIGDMFPDERKTVSEFLSMYRRC